MHKWFELCGDLKIAIENIVVIRLAQKKQYVYYYLYYFKFK